MAKRTFYRLTGAELDRLWAMWGRGETLRAIGKSLNIPSGCVHRTVAQSGGIAPLPRKRAQRVLSSTEREEISRGVASGDSVRRIAVRLGRATSTVSREVERNGGREQYRAAQADTRAWSQARRPQRCLLARRPDLARLVSTRLTQLWSPEQVAGWLKLVFPDDESMHVSHETIYRTLFVQARGALKKELQKHLRAPRSVRKPRRAEPKVETRGQIVDAVPISQRPPEAADRAVPGHWEGDLLSGAKNSHVATLVERRSRYVHVIKVDGKDTQSVVSALIKSVKRLPESLRGTLTWDRGTELANHKQFTVATDVKVYFCDPRSPWQRGSNENTNGLLRQYLPDGTDLSKYSQAQLNKIADSLNGRPRKTLGFRTPAETLAETVAMTG